MDLPHDEGEGFLRTNDKETAPTSNGLISVVESSSPEKSLGFDVVPTHQTTTSQDTSGGPMDGYMSAMSDSEYVQPEAENTKKFLPSEDSDVRSASPAETGETGSFHTPDVLDTSSELRDEPDFSVVIPQLEDQTPIAIDRTLRVEDKRGGTQEEEGRESEGEEDVTVVEEEHPPREFVVEQPKLLLADPVGPMPEKEPLPPSLSNTAQNVSRPHQRVRSRGHPPVTETTPLISGSDPENQTDETSSCCTIL